jgi:hypothetical protein
MAHSDVIQRFQDNKPNRNEAGKCIWRGHNVFCDEDALFSFGRHYVLAFRLGDGRFLKNADRVSSTTSHHINQCSYLPGPVTSFSTLRAAGVFPDELTPANFLEVREDDRSRTLLRLPDGGGFVEEHCHYEADDTLEPYRSRAVYTYTPWEPPSVGQFFAYTHTSIRHDRDGKIEVEGYGRCTLGFWHILGALLLDVGGRRLLGTIDDGTYCIIECPGQPSTIDEAFTSITPAGLPEKYERQGEWFFVPTGMDDRALARQTGLGLTGLRATVKRYGLPDSLFVETPRPDSRNLHECSILETTSAVFAKGRVVHKRRSTGWWDRGGASGEHLTINLGEEWHRVLRATELASWTQDRRTNRGGVD